MRGWVPVIHRTILPQFIDGLRSSRHDLADFNPSKMALDYFDYAWRLWVDYNCGNVMVKRAPKITDTEGEIRRVIWTKHPITASEIIERLAAEDPSWHPKTARADLCL
jgi:hypothetical protein